jgi:CRP/FNR family cyclic AMP-dependent transcriptional regulator
MDVAALRAVILKVLGKRLFGAEADEIMRATVAVDLKAGEVVMREGDQPRGLFLLLDGSVDVLKTGDHGSREVLATVTAPTVLGEMSLLAARSHSASVVARTDCALRLLPRDDFARLLDGGSLAAYKLVATIAEVLAGRLLRMDEKVVELSQQRAAGAPVQELAAFKDKLFSDWSF